MPELGYQEYMILELLRARGSAGLTQLEALDLVGSMRLASRIFDLHCAGYRITSERIVIPSGKCVALYRLVEDAGEQLALDL
jgi:hypothetical protein